MYLGLYLALLGEFPEALERSEEAVRIADEAGQPYSRIAAHFGAGEVDLIRGDNPHAIARLAQGLQLGQEWNLLAASSLALAHARTGRLAEALSLAAQGVEWSGTTPGLASSAIRLGETYLVVGRLADAVPCADRALALFRDRKERGYEALALHLLGEIAAHRDPPDVRAAEGHYREALVLADEFALRPLVAHCHLGLGKLYRRTGDQAKAAEHLTTATTMYREMGMNFWLEKAETELGTAP